MIPTEEKIEKTDKNSQFSKLTPEQRTVSLIVVGILISALAGFGGGYLAFQKYGNPLASKNLAQNTVVLQDSAITDTVKKVNPSVVAITVKTTTYNFFGQAQQSTASGSGFIVSSDGLIVTNKHVASDKTATYTVSLASDKQYTATVKAQDPKYDLAILKINATGLTPVSFGDSDKLKVGQTAIAIGNPLGQYQNTVTVGVISGLGRSIQAGDASTNSTEQLDNLLQTDAAINPGNSGGPLTDASGAVVGIVTAVDTQAQGIGFAIPVNLAKSALESYLKTGSIQRSYLGVRYVTLTQDYATQNNLSVSDGAFISGTASNPGIVDGSPAFKAGLKEGDIITKINNDQITESQTLTTLVSKYVPGTQVQITYIRDGKTKTASVTLEKSN